MARWGKCLVVLAVALFGILVWYVFHYSWAAVLPEVIPPGMKDLKIDAKVGVSSARAATMRNHTNVLTIVFVLCGLWIGSASAIAAKKLEASLTLDKAKTFSLSIAQCAKGLNETTVNLGLIVDEKATVSPELAKLRNVQKDAKRNMDLCINSDCKGYTWEYTDVSGFPSWWTSLTLERNRERIDSVRIVIPNDSANYEFRGDVDGILRRICK